MMLAKGVLPTILTFTICGVTLATDTALEADAISVAKAYLGVMQCGNADYEMRGSLYSLFQFQSVRYVAHPRGLTELDRMNKYEWRGEVVRVCRLSRMYETSELEWGDWEKCEKTLYSVSLEKQKEKWYATDGGSEHLEYTGPPFKSESNCTNLPKETQQE